MQSRSIPLALWCAAVLLGSSPSLAADKAKPAAAPASASQANASAPSAQPKRVDINSASRAELKTLPGIGDAEASRIIAARPYPSKTKLAVDQVLPEATYQAIKGRIVATQPEPAKPKTGAKTTAKP
jgi:DNA uptake protein ComE-like DNA-binding protein